MAEKYIAKHGDCITSIADAHGFFWVTVWDHAQNKALKDRRKDPNTLMEGDAVFIPDKRRKLEEIETGKKHRFGKKGVPALFRIQLLEEEKPLANLPFELNIRYGGGTATHIGTTTSEGVVEATLPTDATSAQLLVGPETDQKEYQLEFGLLPPIDEVAGIQARLQNLGYFDEEISGRLDSATTDALTAFQNRFNLQATGKPDQKTKDKLLQIHDNPGLFPQQPSNTQ